MIPAVLDALGDRRLSRRDLRVYGQLLRRLDLNQFRWVKSAAIAVEVKTHRTRAGRSIRRLMLLGYLAEGPRDGHYRTYRLLYSPSVPETAQKPAA